MGTEVRRPRASRELPDTWGGPGRWQWVDQEPHAICYTWGCQMDPVCHRGAPPRWGGTVITQGFRATAANSTGHASWGLPLGATASRALGCLFPALTNPALASVFSGTATAGLVTSITGTRGVGRCPPGCCPSFLPAPPSLSPLPGPMHAPTPQWGPRHGTHTPPEAAALDVQARVSPKAPERGLQGREPAPHLARSSSRRTGVGTHRGTCSTC